MLRRGSSVCGFCGACGRSLAAEKGNRAGREALSQSQPSDISRGAAELGRFPQHSRVSLPMESPFNDMLLTAAFRGVRRGRKDSHSRLTFAPGQVGDFQSPELGFHRH